MCSLRCTTIKSKYDGEREADRELLPFFVHIPGYLGQNIIRIGISRKNIPEFAE